MSGTLLSRAGVLTQTQSDGTQLDVTHSAVDYLYENVAFADDLLLSDAFEVLRKNPLLLQLFRSVHAQNFVERACATPAEPYNTYAQLAIEYLELGRCFELDTDKGVFEIWPALDLAGVTFALREPYKDDGGMSYPVGHRDRYSIAGTSPHIYMNYPLRFSPIVDVGKKLKGRATTDDGSWKLISKLDMGLPRLWMMQMTLPKKSLSRRTAGSGLLSIRLRILGRCWTALASRLIRRAHMQVQDACCEKFDAHCSG